MNVMNAVMSGACMQSGPYSRSSTLRSVYSADITGACMQSGACSASSNLMNAMNPDMSGHACHMSGAILGASL